MRSLPRSGQLACAALIVLAACGAAGDEVDAELTEPFGQARVVLTHGEARVELDGYVADTPKLRRQGLQGWPTLPEDAGMVFVYEQETSGGFWMKDTLIELSIAFADADGRIHTILDMEPCAEEPCPTYSPGEPYQYALEVNQGAFADLGVQPGWQLDVTALRECCG